MLAIVASVFGSIGAPEGVPQTLSDFPAKPGFSVTPLQLTRLAKLEGSVRQLEQTLARKEFPHLFTPLASRGRCPSSIKESEQLRFSTYPCQSQSEEDMFLFKR